MIRIVLGVVLALHGLVHLWFVTLAMRWVEFQPDKGWNGRSWLVTPLLGDAAARIASAALLVVATVMFIVGRIAVLAPASWWRPALILASILSSAVLLIVWDGGTDMLARKGLIGVGINLLVLLVALR